MKSSAIPLRYGVILGVILIVYFLILSLFGLHTYVWFSLANAVFTGIGIFIATRDFKAKKKNFRYHKGFVAGLKTGFIATVIFTVFFAIYASNINPSFTDELLSTWHALPVSGTGFGQIILVVATMGFVSTFILTFVCMQLFKDSWNTHHPKQNEKSEGKVVHSK